MLSRQNKYNDFNSSGKKKSKTLLVSILAIILLLGVVTPIRSTFVSVLNFAGKPFWIIKDRLSVKLPAATNYLSSKSKLHRENLALQDEVRRLNDLLVANQALEIENQELKEILAVSVLGDDRLASQILSRPRSSGFDTLIIASGRASGVSVGDLVYGGGHFVLGQVIELYQDTSKVKLFSYSDSKTNILLGSERAALFAVGEGGQNFSVEFPADIEIKEGDIAVLEDRSGSILARVEKILSTPGGLISKAILASPVNVNELRFVEVALGSSEVITTDDEI